MNTSVNLEIHHHSVTPTFSGEDHQECFIYNRCDGWHVAYMNFYEDGEFEGFTNFTMTETHKRGEFFDLWCVAPSGDEILANLKDLAA